jgi:hypothetical protein
MNILEKYLRVSINDCYPNYSDLSKKQRDNIRFLKDSLKNKDFVNISFDELSFDIGLAHTHTKFGGVRNWYICPFCKKKYVYLYFDEEQNKLACRRCLKLTYTLSAESHKKSYSTSKLCKYWAKFDVLSMLPNRNAKQKRELVKKFFILNSLFENYKRFTEDKLEKLGSEVKTI